MPSVDLPPPIVEQSLSTFDLTKLSAKPLDIEEATGTKPCSASSSTEIVVCGQSIRHYRLHQLAGPFGLPAEPLRAAIKLGAGSRLNVHGDSATLANGALSNRVMVTLSHKF